MSIFRPLCFRKDINKLDQVQQKATQVVRRLKHLLCREAEGTAGHLAQDFLSHRPVFC